MSATDHSIEWGFLSPSGRMWVLASSDSAGRPITPADVGRLSAAFDGWPVYMRASGGEWGAIGPGLMPGATDRTDRTDKTPPLQVTTLRVCQPAHDKTPATTDKAPVTANSSPRQEADR